MMVAADEHNVSSSTQYRIAEITKGGTFCRKRQVLKPKHSAYMLGGGHTLQHIVDNPSMCRDDKLASLGKSALLSSAFMRQ